MGTANGSKGGVSITVASKWRDKVVQTGTDPEGRFIWLHLQKGDKVLGFCSLYAPCDLKRMWRKMKEHLDDELEWSFGGDYNFIEDSANKLGSAFKAHTTVSLEWQELRDRVFRLMDPWVTNPAQRRHPTLEFSWNNGSKNPDKFRARRLDRIYIPGGWMQKVTSFGIATATVKSDHSPVVLSRAKFGSRRDRRPKDGHGSMETEPGFTGGGRDEGKDRRALGSAAAGGGQDRPG